MLSCDGGFLPTDGCKYSIFFTINAPLEYYFFNYKEIATFSEGKKKKSLTALLKTSIKRNKLPRTTC